jgi:Ion channel
VITLTTAGLGDLKPTTSFNKIICSIFIYFGVACIGLLLGSYIAAMLDESTRRQARENRINACPNCTRLQNIKDAAEKRALATPVNGFVAHRPPLQKALSERMSFVNPGGSYSFQDSDLDVYSDDDRYHQGNKKIKRGHERHDSLGELPSMQSPFFSLDGSSDRPSPRKTMVSAVEVSPFTTTSKSSTGSSLIRPSTMGKIPEGEVLEMGENEEENGPPPPPPPLNSVQSHGSQGNILPSLSNSNSPVSPMTPRQTQGTPRQMDLLGSPMTKEILGRQSHTRHESIDLNGNYTIGSMSDLMGGQPYNHVRKHSFDEPKVSDTPSISESIPFVPGTSNSTPNNTQGVRFEQDDSLYSDEAYSSDDESSAMDSDSWDSYDTNELNTTKIRVRTAKYVFLTLKQALVNSLVIIAVGCLGFWFIEGFNVVDSKWLDD